MRRRRCRRPRRSRRAGVRVHASGRVDVASAARPTQVGPVARRCWSAAGRVRLGVDHVGVRVQLGERVAESPSAARRPRCSPARACRRASRPRRCAPRPLRAVQAGDALDDDRLLRLRHAGEGQGTSRTSGRRSGAPPVNRRRSTPATARSGLRFDVQRQSCQPLADHRPELHRVARPGRDHAPGCSSTNPSPWSSHGREQRHALDRADRRRPRNASATQRVRAGLVHPDRVAPRPAERHAVGLGEMTHEATPPARR